MKLSRRELIGSGAIGLLGAAGSAAPALAGSKGEGGGKRPIVTWVAGEPSGDAVILQARFSSQRPLPGDANGTSPGVAGSARFEFADNPAFARSSRTEWLPVAPEGDFIARTRLVSLKPDTVYHYRAEFRDLGGRIARPVARGSFRTLPLADDRQPLSFAVISCMSYELFFGFGANRFIQGPWSKPADGEARRRGYPAMDHAGRSEARFVVATGDTVYYDHPQSNPALWARTVPEMREKWHRQFALPALAEALAAKPFFFMKDDHDFRFDDADNTGATGPTPEDGRKLFLEQVPLLPDDGRTYRTVRVNKHVQVWLLEGRDYRSPNAAPDGSAKMMWGADQGAWLETTLLASDADFKLVISPTPIVGPDDSRKSDNQASLTGFHREGENFLAFLRDHDLTSSTFIINGDRHWKYHSIHPSGVEEFACGTVHRQNSRPGVAPGDKRGTDPEARIRQPYLQPIPDGGYLQVDVEPDREGGKASLVLRFWGEDGDLQYAVRRFGKRPPIAVPGSRGKAEAPS